VETEAWDFEGSNFSKVRVVLWDTGFFILFQFRFRRWRDWRGGRGAKRLPGKL